MSLLRSFAAVIALAVCLTAAPAQEKKAAKPADKKGADEVHLVAATGVVEKADKDSVSVTPRGTGGRFEKAVTLKVTGTTKVTVLTPQKRAGKGVLTQQDATPADLVAGQAIAVVYAETGDGPVLLSAVARPAAGK
jgi:hypothetical protein